MSWPSRKDLALLALILCVYGALFGRAVSYEYVWDDVAEIAETPLFDRPLLEGIGRTQTERMDPTINELVGVQRAYDSYRPLLFASYWVEVQLWGRSSSAMHITNLVLGALGILCVFALSRRMLEPSPVALVPTAIFALHPVQVEAVVYVSGRGDLLAGLLALIATMCVLRYLDRKSRTWPILAALAFAGSLLAKESCLALPFAIGGVLWAKHQLRARWWIIAMLLAVALGYLVLRRTMVVPTTSSALRDGLVALPGVCLEYLRIALLPFDLSTERVHEDGYVWLGWGAIVLAAAAIGIIRVRRIPLARPAIASAAWFLLLLAPSAIAIAASTRVLADRYAYAPLAGLAIAVTGIGIAVTAKVPRVRRPVAAVAALWGAMLVVVTWLQVPVWQDNETLYTHAVAMTPESSDAHYRLAYLSARVNNWQRAMPLLERAIELDPRNVRALVNLGVGQLRTRRADDAEETLERAVVANPAAYRAWFNLGLARLTTGKHAEGCGAIARALEIHPGYALAARTLVERCRK